MNKTLNFVHLYPKHMSLYGDRGGVLVLTRRARLRGINMAILEVNPGDDLPPQADMIMLGGGQDFDQQRIVTDLLAKKSRIEELINAGAVYLGICGGYQMAGNSYQIAGEQILPGLQLLDFKTVQVQGRPARAIGNVAVQTAQWGTLYGFENHGGRTHLGLGLIPLGKVLRGMGNNGLDGGEGVLSELGKGLVLGTYLHSFLANNPAIADYLIARMVGLESHAELSTIDDAAENLMRLNLKTLSY